MDLGGDHFAIVTSHWDTSATLGRAARSSYDHHQSSNEPQDHRRGC